jgi:hypothetical protein
MARLICFLFCFPSLLLGQSDSPPARFRVGLAAGIGYYNVIHDFSASPFNVFAMPRYAGAVSVSYGLLPLINSTGIELSVQASYSYSSTGVVEGFAGPVEAKWEFTEFMVWPKLIVDGTFSPFIEIGVGIGSITAHEEYTFSYLEDVNSSSSGLKLGVGGGAALALTEYLRLDAYGQAIYLMKDVSYSANKNSWTSHTPAVFVVAARIIFSL